MTQKETKMTNVIDLKSYDGLRVLFLHLTTAPISFYRMVQYAEHMVDIEGIIPVFPKFEPDLCDYNLREFEQKPDENLHFLQGLFDAVDMVVCGTVHMTKFGCVLKALSHYYGTPLIMECDDAPFNIDASHPNSPFIGTGSEIERNAYDQLRDSDAVVCSTEYLRGMLRVHNKDVNVIPNALNPARWDFAPLPKEDGKIILGWAGASAHEKDLGLVRRAFINLLDRYSNLHIRCLHGAVDLLDHPRFENVEDWVNILDYPEKLHSMNFDIAVAPLWDSEFNRAKSNLRYLEYSMLGIPTVASPVYPYKNTIEEGTDGYFASTTGEWVDKISKLCDNTELRTNIGQNAKQKVIKEYNSELVAQKYADLLKQLFNRYRRKDGDIPAATG